MNDARDGMQSGPWHDTRENRIPSAARPSSDGVWMLGSPEQPIMSARCWSDITSTMFGLLAMAASSPDARRSLTGGPAGVDLGMKRSGAGLAWDRPDVQPGPGRTLERTVA